MNIYINPVKAVNNLWSHRDLIIQFTRRDVIGRYRGSQLGFLWSLLNPLLMLVIYTFVFSVVFKSKWGTGSTNKSEFALLLFCGITAFNIFAEIVTRAPGLVVGNVNYVKKVVFPLEVLPITIAGSAIVHASISFLILIAGIISFLDVIKWTIIFLPLVLLPLLLLSLGLAWLLSSLGTYLRDIGHIVSLGVTALMFISPIFYPVTAIPESFQYMYFYNPISYVVEDMRNIMVIGHMPNWGWLLWGTIVGFVFAYIGHLWFMKTKGGFADVL